MGNGEKVDNLWVKWVHAIYIKQQSWWDYNPSKTSSWYWRQVWSVKNQLKAHYTQLQFQQMSQYSITEVYTKLSGEYEKLQWCSAIWGRMGIPKHQFCSWVAIQGRLQTREKLHSWGVSATHTCLICEAQVEDHRHLFFNCEYSSRCLNGIKQ